MAKDMSNEYSSIVRDVGKVLKKQIRQSDTKITLFLLGPGDNSKSNGRQLRSFLQKKCEKFGIVVKGEHKELIKIFHKETESMLNLCIMERWFAEKFATAVIIIPDSPGSLVELGMFVFNKKLYKKTLLLFSTAYSEDGFITKGPKSHYKLKRTSMERIDYGKKKEAWEIVENFLLPFKAEKMEKALLRS